MDNQLVVLYFESPDAAELALATLRTLEAEGFLQIDDCALLARDPQGWVTAKNADPGEVKSAAGLGGVLGLFVGGVIGLPVVGLLAGAGVAAKRTAHTDRLEQLISSVGHEMAQGSGVLALTLASVSDLDTVRDRLQLHRNGLVRADLPAELHEEIERRLQS